MYEDKQIACQACGNEFTFTAGEQEFYAEKGFQEPGKCKPCRDAAKAARRGPREMFDITCFMCGTQTQVPFQPHDDKPVYCRDCYKKQAG